MWEEEDREALVAEVELAGGCGGRLSLSGAVR